MMTVIMALATAGAGSVAALTSKYPMVTQLLRTVDVVGDLTTYVGPAVRLPAKAAAHIASKVGGHAAPALAKAAAKADSPSIWAGGPGGPGSSWARAAR